MSTCPACHAQNRDGNRMCDQCGTSLITGNWQAPQDRLLRVGRATDNDVVLPDNVSQASRYQAQISVSPNGELVINDMGSSNGTYVNGSRITGPVRFTLADRLSFGSYELSPGLLQPYVGAAAAPQAMVPQYAPQAMAPQYAPPAMQPQYAPPAMQQQYGQPAMVPQQYGQPAMAPYAPQGMPPQQYAPQVVVQQYQPPAMAQPARPVRARKGSGMGVTALIFGIFGMIFSFIFFLPPVMVLGWLFCLLAFIFGIISAATGRGRGMGIAGLIMSLIPLIVLIAGIAAGGSILGGIMGDLSYML